MKTTPALVLLAGAVLIVAGWLIFGRPEVAPESIATGDPIRQFCAACHVYHAALEVADFDGDGDIDIAVGNFVPGPLPGAVNWWTLFDNRGPR